MGLPRSSRAADSRIDILINEPVGEINPNIYGHFVEHLGGVVYDGIWVGEDSRIPNINGIRKELIDALKRIKAPLFRYPGGCFADSYDWRDGVGERSKRPRRTNFWSGLPELKKAPPMSPAAFEPNHFGTNEFMKFCQLVGGKAYLAMNVRGLTAQNFYEWIEYCNSPAGSTTLAELRASGSMGSREPFGVEFWGIGNESWGCGGNFTPEEYAQEFRRFTAAYNNYNYSLKFIGAGADSNDLNWTRGFFSKMREKGEGIFNRLYGWGVHHYSWNVSGGRTSDWNEGKGDALRFDTEQHYELLREADRLDSLIQQHWTVMGEYDRQHRCKIAVDEWGSWHRPGTQLKPEHLLGQQNTMRDALVASLTLDIFIRNADKVVMGNIAQLINCLHSLFLADGDKFLLTPTYHVFEMFMPHMGAQSVRALFNSPKVNYTRNTKPAEFWGLSGSASINNKQLTLTVTNADLANTKEAEIAVAGARIKSCRGRVLSAKDIHAHNSFENPRALEPKNEIINIAANGTIVFRFAPVSVTQLQITLN